MDLRSLKKAAGIEEVVHSKFLERHNRIKTWKFTDVQIKTLLQLVEEHSAVILNKEHVHTNTSILKKTRIWNKITAAVIAADPQYPRTSKQVKKKWNDIKAAAIFYMKNKSSQEDAAPPYFEQALSILHTTRSQLSKQEENDAEDAEENDMDLDYILGSENTGQDNEAEAVAESEINDILDSMTVRGTTPEPQVEEVAETEITPMKFSPEDPLLALHLESPLKDAATASPGRRPRGRDPQVPLSTSSLWDVYLKEQIRKSRLKQKVLQKDLEVKELLKQQVDLDMSLKRVKVQYYLEKMKSLFK